MKSFFRKSKNGGWYPHDDETQKYCQRRKAGQIISADIKIARNYENHKRFFSFLSTTFDMQEHFTELEAYRYWLVMKCGYFDTIVAPNGKALFKARSISFESMDEDEFRKLFSTAIDVFIRELGNGITDEQILRVIDYD